ncbi:hypothetical protein Asp14428_36530 [Actinoplanes sp. NBRC 14428]|uniref:Uncharacterized protein n=1 Tax=Pseudosporangium ferrugineum TaxID=439699 RepID=A0A2T0S3P7_9ACTN|nr:hypothetical protein [Pseudosporangium ferrugineum]PRY28054.1 hypothetical protein CLV70_109210 [Pseudosporangium ferrugineum]BCJ52178.1 hypothetical protein Asp14428_36530 [Actinoplanes sp. NBRC 14428]
MRRLRQGVAAVILAATMLLTGTAQPARAADGAADKVVDLALLAWNVYKAGAITPEQAVQFVRLLTGAISETENAVISHIDSIEAREVMGHLRSISYGMADYEAIRENEVWLAEYVRQTLSGYAGNAFEKYRGVSSVKAKDQIALAAQSIYPTLLTVATDAGMPAALARAEADYRELMGDIVKDLEPRCTYVQVHGSNPPHYLHECTAVNGEKSSKVFDTTQPSAADLYDLKAKAAKDSAWLAARRTLDGVGPGNGP